jgi:hypothetical protein
MSTLVGEGCTVAWFDDVAYLSGRGLGRVWLLAAALGLVSVAAWSVASVVAALAVGPYERLARVVDVVAHSLHSLQVRGQPLLRPLPSPSLN